MGENVKNAENIREYIDEILQNTKEVEIGLDYIDKRLNGEGEEKDSSPERKSLSIFEALAMICEHTEKMKRDISRLTSHF